MRVKRGVTTHKRTTRSAKPPKACRTPTALVCVVVNKALTKSLVYATRDRKNRKRTFRELWNARINAAARLNGTTYSKLIAGLKKADVTLDRKILAELAVNEPKAFSEVVKAAK